MSAEYSSARQPFVLDDIEQGIEEIRRGRPVIVVDDENRENEGDLTLAACHATPELLGMMVRYGSGVICVSMEGADLDRLKLPPMVAVNEDPKSTAYTVSVDAATSTTGISSAERARTISVLADPASKPEDLRRPGHVFPLRAVPGGVMRRQGHTEASVDLARLAGLPPVGAICEIVNDDGSMQRLPQLVPFAREHGLAVVSIADLVRYRIRHESHVRRVVETRLPTRHGSFRVIGYRSTLDGSDVHGVALLVGDIAAPGDGQDLPVRIHSECLTGDVFSSHRCDCGHQLDAAMDALAAAGRGILIYLLGHEGRGIGLLHKLQAYALQDSGLDTVDANLALDLPVDARDYSVAAHILADLQVPTVRLWTNNPAKVEALRAAGIAVCREPLQVGWTAENLPYLRTKRDRLGHELTGLDEALAGVGNSWIEGS